MAWTIGTGLVLIALSLPLVGVGGYFDYLTVLGNLSGLTGEENNLDLSSWALSMGADEPAAQLALYVSYGLGIAAMGAHLPEDFRRRFLGTHFFNPPRYMRLMELIPTDDTDPGVLEFVADFSRDRLGKGVVIAKDTPNFIANRVGVHAMMATVEVMQEMGLTIEEVDAVTGPAIGRPKTATFKLGDLVGLDTLLHVADNLVPLVPDDEARDIFLAPDYLRRMVEEGLLGRKTGGGFYKTDLTPEWKKIRKVLDLETFEYKEYDKPDFP